LPADFVAAFVLSFIWGGFVATALPLYGGEVVGLSTSTLGLIMTAGLVVDLLLLLPTGWLSDRLQTRTVLAPALSILVAALLWLPQSTHFWGLLLVSLGLHAGFAAWGMPSAALAMLTQGHRLTRAMAWYRLLVDGAAVIAPWLIGLLIEHYGYGGPSLGTAVVVALTALCVAWGLRPGRQEMSPHPA
jgi:MFS family permease